MRKPKIVVLAAMVAVCASMAVSQRARAEQATDAALVVIEAQETNAAAQRSVKVWYRQIRASRSYIWGPSGDEMEGNDSWGREIWVGLDAKGNAKYVADFEVELGDFSGGGRNAALVIPRHDPEIEWNSSKDGFVRDCLVFEVEGGKPVVIHLSGKPQDRNVELFAAKFPAVYRNRKPHLEYRKGFLEHVENVCPESSNGFPDGTIPVAGVRFSVYVGPINTKVEDVNPSTLRDTFATVDVRKVSGGQGSAPVDVLEDLCNPWPSSSRPQTTSFFVCRKERLPVFGTNSVNSFALLGPNNELVGAVTREPAGDLYRLPAQGDGLRLSTFRGKIGKRLSADDIALKMMAGQTYVSLPMRGSPGELQVSLPAWASANDIIIAPSKRLKPFGLRITEMSDDIFGVDMSARAPNLSIIPSDVAEREEIRDQAGPGLLDWALGERDEIQLRLPFSEPYSLVPRLDVDGQAISLDLSGVRWNVVNLKARILPSEASVPTRDWALSSGRQDVPFPDGFAPSRSVANLLAGADTASVTVHPAGKQFAGFRADPLQLSRDDLEKTRVLTLQADVQPVVLSLTPHLLAGGAAPAFRLRREDGTWIDVLGQVDRFGIEGWKIVSPDGKEMPRFEVRAPSLASIQPLGLIGSGPRELTPSVLENFIKAVEAVDDRERQCKLLSQVMFGQSMGGIVAQAATPDTVVVARRRMSSDRTELTTLADSALSSRFRVFSGWAPESAELWSNGEWVSASQTQCREIGARLSRTLYLLVVVDQFAVGEVVPGRVIQDSSEEDDPFDFLDQSKGRGDPTFTDVSMRPTLETLSDAWSPSADALRTMLTEAGIRTVVVVAAEVRNGRRVFSVVGQVDDIAQKRNLVPFRGLLGPFVDGSIRPTPSRLDEHPRQLRIAFEAELAEKLVPISRLIVLNRPRTGSPEEQRALVSGFDEPAPMKMRSVDGFLNPGASLEDVFREALRGGG